MPQIDYRFLSRILPKAKIKTDFKGKKTSYLNRIRWATSFFFFCNGFTFATWACRIPDIKTTLSLSEADLGSLLFALPIGQLVAMPISGKAIAKYGSRKFSIYATLFYSLCLVIIGLCSTSFHLALALFLFGFVSNFCNIAVNTIGVHTQQLFEKPIMGSFHGSWSLAGFCGALVGLLVIGLKFSTMQHFALAFSIVLLIVLFNSKYLINSKVKEVKKQSPYLFFKNLDKSLVWLGIIAFFCMASEGIMYDWSGVYFKEIVKAPGALVVLGYSTFMVSMTTGRFLSDYLVRKFGSKKVVIVSGLVITFGLYMAVLMPYLIPSTIAFMLVGFGVSNVVPIIFSMAGNNPNVSTSIALTVVSSISFLGFLLGPPVIGYIAEQTSLRYSFATIGLFGLFISVLASSLKVFNVKI